MPTTPGLITLDNMLHCVVREMGMRKRVYPGLVRRGKMTAEDAAWEQACMQAVATLLAERATRVVATKQGDLFVRENDEMC